MTTTTPETPEQKYARQLQRERDAMAGGIRRYRQQRDSAKKKERWHDHGPGRHLMARWMRPTRDAFKAVSKADKKRLKKGGTPNAAVKIIDELGPKEAAFYALIHALAILSTGRGETAPSGRRLADTLIAAVKAKRLHAELEETKPGLSRWIRQRHADTRHLGHLVKSIGGHVRAEGMEFDDLHLSQRERLRIGVQVLGWVQQATGAFRSEYEEVWQRGRKNSYRTPAILYPSESVMEYITKANAKLAVQHPNYQPMVVPPLRWGDEDAHTGHLSGFFTDPPLIRKGRVPAGFLNHLMQLAPTHLFDSLNRHQETGYRYNRRIASLLREIFERQDWLTEAAQVPVFQEHTKPRRPSFVTDELRGKALRQAKKGWTEEQSAEWKEFGKDMERWKQDRQRRLSEIQSFDTNLLQEIERDLDEDSLYWAFSCDFRLRLYPLARLVHPLAGQISTALLDFDTALPLGDSGYDSWATHGANCFDNFGYGTAASVKMGHQPLADRVKWVERHWEDIVACGRDPIEHPMWLQADRKERWNFLRWTVEAADLQDWLDAGNTRETFESRIPIAADASCSGLQLFSLMFRDGETGRRVNLTETDQPYDIYADVALEMKSALVRMAQDGDPFAQRLIDLDNDTDHPLKINRSLAKRGTLSFGYGVRRWGGLFAQFLDYFDTEGLTDTMLAGMGGLEKDGEAITPDTAYSYALVTLQAAIWDAIAEAAPMAFRARAWMQDAAEKIVASGNNIEWTCPVTGTPYWMDCRKEVRRQTKIATDLMGRNAYHPSLVEPIEKLDPIRARDGIAPQIIHSLDALLLHNTVNRTAEQYGITHFRSAHDSLAVHACHAAEVQAAWLEEMVAIFQEPVAEKLWEQFKALVEDPESIPSPEVAVGYGDLDLNEVLWSRYAFC